MMGSGGGEEIWCACWDIFKFRKKLTHHHYENMEKNNQNPSEPGSTRLIPA